MRRLLIAVCVVLIGALLGACTDERTPEQKAGTLVYGYQGVFATFDPAKQRYAQESAIIRAVLEPLLEFDNDVRLVPCLATSWSTPDACSTWEFKLRPDVIFHDGTPCDAAAVKAHFDRVKDPATGSTRSVYTDQIAAVETPDALTVVFHLNTPNCTFPEQLASSWASIPSPAAFAKYGEQIARNPVGTGPFRFVSWEDDVAIRLERNPTYWNAAEYHIDRLEFHPVPEATTRLILLEQGVLDIADISYKHAHVARRADDLSVQTVSQLSIRYIGFNNMKPPFNDKRVRQAANHAINRPDMIKYVLFGSGEAARGPIPTALPDFNPDLPFYDYNPDKARALLAEAGYPDGVDVVMWTTEQGEYKDVAEAILGNLHEVGIRVDLKVFDSGKYWDQFDEFQPSTGEKFPTKKGVFDMFLGGWVGGETAHGFLRPLFLSTSTSNSSFYANPEIDRLLAYYPTLPDEAARSDVYRQMQAIIVDEAPWVFSYYGCNNVGIRHRVRNYRPNAAGMIFLNGVTLDESATTPSQPPAAPTSREVSEAAR